MNSKKKKKDPAAQQLIDSLLDDQTPVFGENSPQSQKQPQRLPSGEKLKGETREDSSIDGSKPNFDSVLKLNLEESGPIKRHVVDDRSALPGAPFSKLESNSNSNSDSNSEALSLELEDKTMRIEQNVGKDLKNKSRPVSNDQAPTSGWSPNKDSKQSEPASVNRHDITELKTIVKMRDRPVSTEPKPMAGSKMSPAQFAVQGASYTSPDIALKQSENLRIAQGRISDLDHELEDLRRENEQLASAGETLRRRADELLSKVENFELVQKELERIHSEEKKVYRGQLQAKERDNVDMRGRLEEMESRLENNFKKIRVRERELEHRLEIVRMESQTLVATKDKMILELKRQIDQIALEGDYAKQKSQEMFNQYKEKQETIRRVVRALRIALTILEGDEDSAGVGKAE